MKEIMEAGVVKNLRDRYKQGSSSFSDKEMSKKQKEQRKQEIQNRISEISKMPSDTSTERILKQREWFKLNCDYSQKEQTKAKKELKAIEEENEENSLERQPGEPFEDEQVTRANELISPRNMSKPKLTIADQMEIQREKQEQKLLKGEKAGERKLLWFKPGGKMKEIKIEKKPTWYNRFTSNSHKVNDVNHASKTPEVNNVDRGSKSKLTWYNKASILKHSANDSMRSPPELDKSRSIKLAPSTNEIAKASPREDLVLESRRSFETQNKNETMDELNRDDKETMKYNRYDESVSFGNTFSRGEDFFSRLGSKLKKDDSDEDVSKNPSKFDFRKVDI